MGKKYSVTVKMEHFGKYLAEDLTNWGIPYKYHAGVFSFVATRKQLDKIDSRIEHWEKVWGEKS